jgi:3-oxoacyl-[acyl-carrier-protein] synthase-1
MNKGIVVTGMGIISALGNSVAENFSALTAGKTGLSYPEFFQTNHSNLPVGEVKFSNEELAGKLNLHEDHIFTRATLFGTIAAKQAIFQASLSKDDLKETGFISGTSVGGMDATEKYYQEYEEKTGQRRFIQAQHPGFTTSQIASYLKLGGYVTTISTACSSSANAIMLGARLIKTGKLKRVVVGGTDCLTKFTLNGFNSLMILSEEFCKAFDDSRNGLNLGEGAAYLVLEADDVLNGKPVLGRILGYGNANDAFHQTASSETGQGAFLAIKKALEIAGLPPEKIDYINAHGTATKNNDLSESTAFLRIFGENVPDFSSTKAFTGHTLAASGGMEAVFSLLALQNDQIFPNLNFEIPMRETGLKPVSELKKKKLLHILSNSFGFGGNCTSLIFSKNEE